MVLQVPPAYTTPILTIDYYQSKFKSRFTITKYASGVPECRSHAVCLPRPPRPAVDSPIHGFMHVISPLARTHRSNAQLDQRPSGIAADYVPPCFNDTQDKMPVMSYRNLQFSFCLALFKIGLKEINTDTSLCLLVFLYFSS